MHNVMYHSFVLSRFTSICFIVYVISNCYAYLLGRSLLMSLATVLKTYSTGQENEVSTQTEKTYCTCGKYFTFIICYDQFSILTLLSFYYDTEFRHPCLQPLWQRNAHSKDFEETASDKMRPAWTVPELLLGGTYISRTKSMQ